MKKVKHKSATDKQLEEATFHCVIQVLERKWDKQRAVA